MQLVKVSRNSLFLHSKYALFGFKIVQAIARPNDHVINLCDVSWFATHNNMAEGEGKAEKRGGRYCAAGAPNKQSCKNTSYTPQISMHTFPKEPTVRAQWIKFVQRHRVDFGEPVNKHAALCSAHFEETCFENDLAWKMGLKKKHDLIGGSVPTRDSVRPPSPAVLSAREKRQVSEHFTQITSLERLCK